MRNHINNMLLFSSKNIKSNNKYNLNSKILNNNFNN